MERTMSDMENTCVSESSSDENTPSFSVSSCEEDSEYFSHKKYHDSSAISFKTFRVISDEEVLCLKYSLKLGLEEKETTFFSKDCLKRKAAL